MPTREFQEAACWKCKGPVKWVVYEDRDDLDSEWLLTCDEHKHEAFS